MNDMYPGFMPVRPEMPETYDSGSHQSHMPMHHRLVKVIQDCEVTCEHMTTFLKRRPDAQMRRRQLMLLRDCADICGLTAKFVARGSMFARQAADLCAGICERCGRECARFPDAESQQCAQVCLNCARECKAFAGSSHMMYSEE